MRLVRGNFKGLPAWTFTGDVELPEPRDAKLPEHFLARSLAQAMGAKRVEITSLQELSARVVVYWTATPEDVPKQDQKA